MEQAASSASSRPTDVANVASGKVGLDVRARAYSWSINWYNQWNQKRRKEKNIRCDESDEIGMELSLVELMR